MTPNPSPSPSPGGNWFETLGIGNQLTLMALLAAILALIFGGRGLVPWLHGKIRKWNRARHLRRASTFRRVALPARRPYYGRSALADECAARLSQSPGLIIEGPRGCGKTALALEVACRYTSSASAPLVAWVSLRNRSVTVETLIEDIAYSLDFQAVLLTPPANRTATLNRLLGGHRTLIVIDNFESIIGDRADAVGLLNELPESAKVLITSSVPIPYVHNLALRHIGGMLLPESIDLIRGEVADDEILSKKGITDSDMQALHTTSGGSPLVLRWALGRMRAGTSPRQVIAELGSGATDIHTQLFGAQWRALSGNSKAAMLLIASQTPGIAVELFDLIWKAAGLADGKVVLNELTSLRMVETEAPATAPEVVLLSLHPLAQTFVAARLSEAHDVVPIDAVVHGTLRFMQDYSEGGTREDMPLVGVQVGVVIRHLETLMRLGRWSEAVELAVASEESFLTLGLMQERKRFGLGLAPYATDSLDRPWRCRLLVTGAQAAGLLGDYELSEHWLAIAASEAESKGIRSQYVRAQRARAANFFRSRQLGLCGRLLADLDERAEESGDLYVLVDVLYLKANFEYFTDDLQGSDRSCERIEEIVNGYGIYHRALAYSLEQIGLNQVERGSWTQALSTLQRARAIAEEYADQRQSARISLAAAKANLAGRRRRAALKDSEWAFRTFDQLGLTNEAVEARAVAAYASASWISRSARMRHSLSKYANIATGGD
jgi:hypothetical protein